MSTLHTIRQSSSFQTYLPQETIYSTLTSIPPLPTSSGNSNLSIALVHLGQVELSFGLLLDMTWHSAIDRVFLSFTRKNARHRHFTNHVCLYGFCLGFPGTYGYSVFIREYAKKTQPIL